MWFKILNSEKQVDVKVAKYLIDWDKKVTRGGWRNFGDFQFRVKKLLHPFWKEEIVLEEFKVPGVRGQRNMSIDLLNLTRKIAVEVSGRQHHSKSWSHKTNECFLKQLKRDDFKLQWAELNGFKMVEIYEDDELDIHLLLRLGLVNA